MFATSEASLAHCEEPSGCSPGLSDSPGWWWLMSEVHEPDRPAILAHDGTVLSRGELSSSVIAGAAFLKGQGVGRSDRLALSLAPGPARATGLLSGMAVATVAPLVHSGPRAMIEEELRRLRVTKLVVDDQTSMSVLDAAASIGLPVLKLDPVNSKPTRQELAPSAVGQDLALLMQSSGTTARPKVVPLSHANLLAGASSIVDVLGLGPDDRTLAVLPLFHIHGIVATLLAPLVSGGSVVFCRELAVDEILTQLSFSHPTWLSASPTVLLALLDRAERAGLRSIPHRLRFIRSVTMPLSSEARGRLENLFGVPVLDVYGMTEATSQVCSTRLPWERVVRKDGSVGPAAGPELNVLSSNGVRCPVGEAGEVVIRGASVTRGYEGLEENGWRTDSLGVAWFSTGDEGFIDEHGNLFLTGRSKEMINRGGLKIAPLKVDEALSLHPEVYEALAFSVPHPTLGEDLVAAVVLRPGAGVIEQDLREHLVGLLAAHEVPSGFVFLDSLPRGETGKPLRVGLSKRLPELINAAASPAHGDLEHMVEEAFAKILDRPVAGRDANFFLLGGDSLSSLSVIGRLGQSLGLELPSTLLFHHPSVSGLARHLEELVAGTNRDSTQGVPVIPVAATLSGIMTDAGEPFAASFAQARLWFLHQKEPGLTAYHLLALWRLRGSLNVPALRQALTGLVARHPTLRTSFQLQGDTLLQIIHAPPASFDLPVESAPAGSESGGMIDLWIRQEHSTPFDLESGLLLRARLLSAGPEEHVLLINHHHIASDGWSRHVLTRELIELYRAALSGSEVTLPPLALHYQDFAAWQRNRLGGSRLKELLAYWTRKLNGLEPIVLPTDEPQPEASEPGSENARFEIELRRLGPFESLCRSEGATLHMGLLALLGLLLHRYSQQADFAIGIPMGGRGHPELEPLIGLFVNTLPIRIQFEAGQTFRQLLGQVRRTSIEAYEHQDLPFERIVKAHLVDRDAGGNPLVDAILQFSSAGESDLQGMDGLQVERLPASPGPARFALEFFVRPAEQGGVGWTVTYDATLFHASTIGRLCSHLDSLFTSVTSNPDLPVTSLAVLPSVELDLIECWQTGPRIPKSDDVLDHLFERSAARYPDVPAVVFDDQAVSYRELGKRADLVACRLLEAGVGPDVIVAVCLDRSLDLVVSILGVLKAGGAYLPLDPAWPGLRLRSVLQASRVEVMITDRDRLAVGASDQMRLIHPQMCQRDESCWEPVRSRATQESLAYVLYTSGSTGEPKGVAMPNGPLVNLLSWQAACIPGAARTLQFASLSFDVSFQEIFSTWFSGGTLVLVSDQVRRDPSALLAVIRRDRVERLFLPVVMLAHLSEAALTNNCCPESLKEVVVAGEALRITPEIRQFFEALPSCRLWNHYGPTETHVVTGYRMPIDVAAWPDLPPIGQPIWNADIHVLDTHGERVPIGVAGDIWIGGAPLARGYLFRDDLTADLFVEKRLGDRLSKRFYRTGDRGRWRPDGELEFLGRKDHQVKIRGHRVELGEIESVLSRHPEVKATSVVVRGGADHSRRITGFVVVHADGINASTIREWLQERLPGPMVPAEVFVVPVLPLNANGKVDRKLLETFPLVGVEVIDSANGPGAEERAGPTDSVPNTVLELEILMIWQQLFRLEHIDTTSDFFEMGGDSLMAVQLAVELDQLIGHRIPINMLFEAPTVKALAAALEARSWGPAWESLVPLQPRGGRIPLFIVHGWGGDVFYASRFARLLGPDQPVFGVRAKSVGRDDSQPVAEEMARNYAREIRALQPEGPYQLAGYSIGGWFAYAVATELRNQGQQVVILVFDSNPYCRLSGPARGAQLLSVAAVKIARVWYHARKLVGINVSDWPGYLASPMRVLFGRGMGRVPKSMGAPEVRATGNQVKSGRLEQFVSVIERFSASPINAQVEFFQAKAPSMPSLIAAPQALVWRLLVRGPFTVHRLACDHWGIFSEENLPLLAALVDSVLKDANRELD